MLVNNAVASLTYSEKSQVLIFKTHGSAFYLIYFATISKDLDPRNSIYESFAIQISRR